MIRIPEMSKEDVRFAAMALEKMLDLLVETETGPRSQARLSRTIELLRSAEEED